MCRIMRMRRPYHNNYKTLFAMKEEKIPMMSFGEAVGTCLKKYFCFKGRARRSEYWWFVAFILAGDALLFLLTYGFFPMIVALYLWNIVLLIPSLTACVRRLHDTEHAGRNVLLGPVLYIIVSIVDILFGTRRNDLVVPFPISLILWIAFFYSIVVFILTLRNSDHRENKYGPSPKYRMVDEQNECKPDFQPGIK